MSENRNSKITAILYLICRIGIGVIFIAASWEKLFDPEAFSQVVINYQILPENLVNPVAYILPWVELITGVLLISGRFVSGGAFIFNLMMSVFISVFIYNKIRGLDINCGCFSMAAKPPGNAFLYITRDIAFLISGLFVLFYHFRMKRAEKQAE